MENLSFVLALEGTAPTASSTTLERVLEYLVRRVQPEPSITHIELFISPLEDGEDPHFATYMGNKKTVPPEPYTAGWGTAFEGGEKFYTDPGGNFDSWRAVPIVMKGATGTLRNEAKKHVGTPYGMWWGTVPYLYLFAVPPFRALAGWLSDNAQDPAHCATLVARILKGAFPKMALDKPSSWYGPSTLFLELSRRARMEEYASIIPAVNVATNKLVLDNDDDIKTMTAEQCQCEILHLSRLVIENSVSNNVGEERHSQKDLAKALLRWHYVKRRSSSDGTEATNGI